jgi:hypothetical protein
VQTGGYFVCQTNAREGVNPPVDRFPGESRS